MNLGKLIIDIDGTELTQEDKDILKHPNIGGVIKELYIYRSGFKTH